MRCQSGLLTLDILIDDKPTVRVSPLCKRARTLERVRSQDPSREYYLLSFEEVQSYHLARWQAFDVKIVSPTIMAVGYGRS